MWNYANDFEVRDLCNAKIEKAIAEAAEDRLAHRSPRGEIIRRNGCPATSLDHEAAQGPAGLAGGFLRLLQLAAGLHLR